MSAENRKPAMNIQVGGVQIPIWKNEGPDGAYYKAGAPELRYRDAAGEWHTGKSYSQRDLLNLAKAVLLAHSELGRLSHAESDEEQEAA
jgi:hypothetical protein